MLKIDLWDSSIIKFHLHFAEVAQIIPVCDYKKTGWYYIWRSNGYLGVLLFSKE